MSGFGVPIFLTVVLWCQVGKANLDAIDWKLREKLNSLEYSLIGNKNLAKYAVGSDFDMDLLRLNIMVPDGSRAPRMYNKTRCIEDLQWLQRSNNSLWNERGLKMFDLWGRLPNEGTETDFGSFEECLNIEQTRFVSGTQYCILDVKFRTPDKLLKTQTLGAKLGICIPESCSAALTARIITDYLDTKEVVISIPTDTCSIPNDDRRLLPRDIYMIVFIISALTLVFLSTIYELACHCLGRKPNPILIAFSAFRNSVVLFSCRRISSPNMIGCFIGIRPIVMGIIALYHFHVVYQLTTIDYHPSNDFNRGFQDILKALALYGLDTFFFMSGVLATQTVLRITSKKDGFFQLIFKPFYLIFHRCLRIIPVFAFLVMFHVTLYKFCFRGPLSFMTDQSRMLCESRSWKTFLMFESMCMIQTWYLGVEMRYFIFAPILVIIMRRIENWFVGLAILIILGDFSTMIYRIRHLHIVPEVIYTPYHRFSPWLIGLVFGYYLYKYRSKKISIPKYLNVVAWLGSFLVMILIAYYTFRQAPDALNMFVWEARIGWTLALCWITFSCFYGHAGLINSFLSHPLWQPLARLSFNTYLVHLLVFTVAATNMQHGDRFSKYGMIETFIIEMIYSNAIAVVLSLMLEMPLIALDKACWYWCQKKFDDKQTNEQDDEQGTVQQKQQE